MARGGGMCNAAPSTWVYISQAELAALTNNSQGPIASCHRSLLLGNADLEARVSRTASVWCCSAL